MELYNVIYNYLNHQGVKSSKKYLRERLEAHADHPSLKAITDTLDDFKVESQAIRLENKEDWKELDFPFLAHMFTPENGEQFQIIKSRKDITLKNGFLKKWTGIVLLLDENGKISNEEHNYYHKKEKQERAILWTSISLLGLFFIIQQVLNFQFTLFIHFMLSITGLIITGAIIAYSMGTTTDISDIFCKVGKSGCKKVLGSKLGRFAGDIGLGDLAAVFFGGMIIYLFFANSYEIKENLSLLIVIQSLAFVLTLVSIFYQAYLRSWCKLCLAATFILWLQMTNLVLFFENPTIFFTQMELSFGIVLVFGMSILLASFWFLAKPLIISSGREFNQRIRIRKWRQDPKWFDVLLPLHKKVDDSLWEKEIYYGNPSGALQFIIVSNPYCPSCAKAHHELHKILDKHPKDVGIRIRFVMEAFDMKKKEYRAISKILNAYEELVWRKKLDNMEPLMKNIITDWYNDPNLDQWERKYNFTINNPTAIDELIKKSIQWSYDMQVSQTPAFFVNGHEMPEPHTFKDVFAFVSDYIDLLKNR